MNLGTLCWPVSLFLLVCLFFFLLAGRFSLYCLFVCFSLFVGREAFSSLLVFTNQQWSQIFKKKYFNCILIAMNLRTFCWPVVFFFIICCSNMLYDLHQSAMTPGFENNVTQLEPGWQNLAAFRREQKWQWKFSSNAYLQFSHRFCA